MKKIHVFLSAALFYLAVAYPHSQVHAQPGGAFGPVPVIVSPVVQRDFAGQIEALGTTKANETAVITASVSETVSEIHFKDGGVVTKGEVLLTLGKAEEEADLKAAEGILSEKQTAYKRAEGLEKKQALSTATLQERQASLRQIEGQVEAMQSRINDRIITAPFDGRLGLRKVSPGTLVRPGDEITTIDDLSQIKVDFDVPAVFLKGLKAGLKVKGEVDGFEDTTFDGEVQTVGTQIDPTTRTVTVRAVLPNPDEALRPGLLMNITLYMNPRKALVIPEEAIIQREDTVFVFVIEEGEEGTVARQKMIKTGQRLPGDVEVLSGLAKDDKVIVHGTMMLRDGAPVSIRAIEDDNQSLDDLIKSGQQNVSENEKGAK